MQSEANKILIQEYVERVWNQADLTAFRSLTTPTYTYIIGGQEGRNLVSMEQFLVATHTAFPDWRVEIIDMIAEGNKVTIRWQGEVTHQGNFNSIPATGRRIHVSGINIYHIMNDKVAVEWEQTDTISMLQQMGVLPT